MVLERHNFRVSWEDGTTVTAESGSKVLNFVAGSLAQYYKVGVRGVNAHQDDCAVRVGQISRGWMGGLWGTAKTRNMLTTLRAELESAFANARILRHGRDQ